MPSHCSSCEVSDSSIKKELVGFYFFLYSSIYHQTLAHQSICHFPSQDTHSLLPLMDNHKGINLKQLQII